MIINAKVKSQEKRLALDRERERDNMIIYKFSYEDKKMIHSFKHTHANITSKYVTYFRNELFIMVPLCVIVLYILFSCISSHFSKCTAILHRVAMTMIIISIISVNNNILLLNTFFCEWRIRKKKMQCSFEHVYGLFKHLNC